MSEPPRVPLLPRLLFVATVACAAGLLGMVLLAPWLDEGSPRPHGWARLVAAFARDGGVRRVTIAACLGLLVTAWVFFRPPRLLRPTRREPRPPRTPPSGGVVGA